jgi:hypothetical protein
MTQVARDGRLFKESLYKALSRERRPSFDTNLPGCISSGLEAERECEASSRGGLSSDGEAKVRTRCLWRSDIFEHAPGVDRPPQAHYFATAYSLPATQWQRWASLIRVAGGGAYQERSPLGVLSSAPPKAYSGWKIKGCGIGCCSSSSVDHERRIERPAPGRGVRPARLLRAVQPHPPGAWISEHQAATACCGRG